MSVAAAAAVWPAIAVGQTIDSGDTAWMLTSSVLVLFMTIPGLALFYAGLVRAKNVLSVMMQCFAITCMVTILWTVYAYGLAFGDGGALNSFVGWDTNTRGAGEPAYRNQPNTRYQSYLKMSDSAKGPSELFTFIEVHPVSLCRPFFGHHMNQSFYHVPAGYHNGRAALGYIDGGARVHKWMDPQTKQLLTRTDEAHWGGHSHGNSRNKDVIWLQERATVIKGRR